MNHILITCPLCSEQQWQNIKEGWNVLLCDIDTVNGCDEYFAVEVFLKFEMKYFTLSETKGI